MPYSEHTSKRVTSLLDAFISASLHFSSDTMSTASYNEIRSDEKLLTAPSARFGRPRNQPSHLPFQRQAPLPIGRLPKLLWSGHIGDGLVG